MHIIITGDPVSGFEFVGPFKDGQAAISYGDRHEKSLGPSFWISGVSPADVSQDVDEKTLIELTPLQGKRLSGIAWTAAKYTDDAAQIDYLITLSNRIQSRLVDGQAADLIVYEFTRGDCDAIRGLIYEAMKNEDDARESDFLGELVDQFEQCMDGG